MRRHNANTNISQSSATIGRFTTLWVVIFKIMYRLNNLAAHLSTRFDHQGNSEDLDQAIALHREALALRPVGHTDRSSSLNNLASGLSTHFDHRGNAEDLDQAIALAREALALLPVGHTGRSNSLGNLAALLSTRFDHRGNAEDLNESRENLRCALTLANGKSLSQQYISSYMPSLTALMRARRSHDGSPSVPFAAIGQNLPDGASFTLDCVEPELELVRGLLPLPPAVSFTKITSVDPTKSRALRALRDNTWLHLSCHGTQTFDDPFKSAFLMRDQPLSLLDITQMDLSQNEFAFLSACETAVGVPTTPDEVMHLAADRSSSVGNLAVQLSTRFHHRGNPEDLDQAIALQREALALHPAGHTYRSWSLNHLAAHLSTRFHHRGNPEDLDQAIALLRLLPALYYLTHAAS
ncbi:hypothetical protein P692DRAFT_20882755 [Suillus brevipes Sb2]|nr:hypothetical protein P692DRAFT_20882755 [Suillus brevipes Sb2]